MKRPMARHREAFRPNISLKRPYSGRKLVEVSIYAAGTQAETVPALNEADMVGNAVATTVESRLETSKHIDKPTKTITICRNGSKLLWSVRLNSWLFFSTGSVEFSTSASWVDMK